MTSVTINLAGGRERALDEATFVSTLGRTRDQISAPYHESRLALAAGVGGKILRGSRSGVSPAVVHFAYWTRAAALKRLAEEFAARLPSGCLARPVGLVFHLPPQNVETVFLYSWMLSYLAGNANVVRLPTALGDEMRGLLDLFLEAFEAEGEEGQLFINYPAASTASVSISAGCDARVVWGGDAKVAAFADVPLRQGGKSVWFGDRYSLSVMHGAALAALDPAGLRDLAEKFCNDLYVFDQMACSSPHALYVVGDAAAYQTVVHALFDAVGEAARGRQFEVSTGHAIRKMVEVFAASGRGETDAVYWSQNHLMAAQIAGPEMVERRVGGGYLQYSFLEGLDKLQPAVRSHHQTLTYFGFERDDMAAFAGGRVAAGLTRIVPVGSALDFDFVWDGYDLPRELTHLVRVL